MSREDEWEDDFRYILLFSNNLKKNYTSVGSIFSNIAADKSNDGDRPGFSEEEEEECRLTINNALVVISLEESVDLRAKKIR